ncbi:hypothetical protein NC653_035593 [Populus alba x Populus x berolinensis]|uniref:Uncharacterized protein n=1 Tax=Populus alba x Populus x berolinensis TaxID=444605 RepID=A0AAD6LQI4_9ROSI|nr:hypothetical protein NC653_035593 [Populus alba x Populus x berolinensis]
MSLFIANGNGGGGRYPLHQPHETPPLHPHSMPSSFPVSTQKITSRSPPYSLSFYKKLSSVSRIGKFDSKNRRSSTTSTKDKKRIKDGSGGDENVNGEVKNVSTSVGENYDGYFLPELPGDEPDFWEGPQWDGLGFFVQYMWAFGIVFALVACGIAVATYNGGAADFKETPAYKESIQSRDLLEEPEASNSDVFDSNPTEWHLVWNSHSIMNVKNPYF